MYFPIKNVLNFIINHLSFSFGLKKAYIKCASFSETL